MENYERLTLDRLQGDTPKRKYDALIQLENENTDYIAKLNVMKAFLEGLSASDDSCEVGNIRSFIDSTYKILVK